MEASVVPFSTEAIAIATDADVPAIVELLNSAYRGEESRKGWTTEADLIGGEKRTDDNHLREIMRATGSVLLKWTDTEGRIRGCVNLQQQGTRLYLGMLSVSPSLQGAGVGKALLAAAETYAAFLGVDCIYMKVISLRRELIDWYLRHGYQETGEIVPFPEDPLTGKHLKKLEFSVLEKKVGK